ncbi:MAG TPA: CAP domain-containing protein [Acidimicrobiales bacterium]|nr:CAP domain-containing protein [Acidimicrobiales bacterium]
MRLRHLLAGMCMAIVGVLVPVAVAPAGAAADPQAAEAAFVAKINALRAAKGLGQLRVDAELTSIARQWAARMASKGDIAHNPSFSAQVQANWVKLGENVGMGPTVDKLHAAFVASPTHYKNLVDGAFELVGVGVVVGANGILFTAHQFERLAPAGTPAPAPAAAAKAAPARSVPQTAAAPAPVPATPMAPAHAVQVLEQLRLFDRPAA